MKPARIIAMAMQAEWSRGQRDRTKLIQAGSYSVLWLRETDPFGLTRLCAATYDKLVKRSKSRHDRCSVYGGRKSECVHCLKAGIGGQSFCEHGVRRARCKTCILLADASAGL